MKTEYTKHYHDPFEHLDQKWHETIVSGFLTVSQAATLSGFTRQHIYHLITEGVLTVKVRNEIKHVPCKAFVKWFSSLAVSPESPLGFSSYSLKGLMDYTGMSRAWTLKFADRHSISSYYVGVFRRFNKHEAENAWKREWFKYAKWITAEEAIKNFNVDETIFYTMVAHHFVAIKHSDKRTLYSKRDIEKELKWRKEHEQGIH